MYYGINEDLPDNEKYLKLAAYFEDPNNTPAKVYVVKYKNRHELIHFVNRIPYVHYHKILPFYKIHNDTGAGDCFAGGFIAGQLSNKLIVQQPAPIELGVLASKTRMTTFNNDEVYTNIEKRANDYFLKKYHNGSNSRRQMLIFKLKNSYNIILGFISGIFTSVIASIIYSLLFK